MSRSQPAPGRTGVWVRLERQEAPPSARAGGLTLGSRPGEVQGRRGFQGARSEDRHARHHVAGRLVAWCEARGGNFRLLTPEVLRQHHPALGPEAMEVLDPVAAVERRCSAGGDQRTSVPPTSSRRTGPGAKRAGRSRA